MRRYLIKKDQQRRILFHAYESKILLLKSIILHSKLLSKTDSSVFDLRKKAFIKLCKVPKDSSVVRIRNRCILTSRARGVISFFKLGRFIFRKLASSGSISGLTKCIH